MSGENNTVNNVVKIVIIVLIVIGIVWLIGFFLDIIRSPWFWGILVGVVIIGLILFALWYFFGKRAKKGFKFFKEESED